MSCWRFIYRHTNSLQHTEGKVMIFGNLYFKIGLPLLFQERLVLAQIFKYYKKTKNGKLSKFFFLDDLAIFNFINIYKYTVFFYRFPH